MHITVDMSSHGVTSIKIYEGLAPRAILSFIALGFEALHVRQKAQQYSLKGIKGRQHTNNHTSFKLTALLHQVQQIQRENLQ